MASLAIESPSPPSPIPSSSSLPPVSIRRGSKKKRKTPRSYPHRSRSRSPIKTRSSSHQVKRGPIKLSRERPPPGAVGAASNKHVQRKFLPMLGFITEDIDIEKIETLEIMSDELANLLACANKHRFSKILYKRNIRDGYYIAEEIDEALVKFGEYKDKDNSDDDIPTCRCVAHQNIKTFFKDRYEQDFCELIRTPPSMNNDNGKKFAVALINIILYHAGRTNFVIQPTEQGSEYSVSYILIDTATAEKQLFQGWPDFSLTDKHMGAGVSLISVGEVQSKEDRLVQLGMYAVGQFEKIEKKTIACIAIYKQKQANIGICSITDDDVISFKLANVLSPIDLTIEEGIKSFANLLCATLDYVVKSD